MATKNTLPAVIGTKVNLKNALETVTPELNNASSDRIDIDKLKNIIRTEVAKSPGILKCRTQTVLDSAVLACQLGLYPLSHAKLAYLVPYGTDCQLIVGYKGLMRLARQAGISISYPKIVYPNDIFRYSYGLENELVHEPRLDWGNGKEVMTHIYCVYQEKGMDKEFLVMTKQEIDLIMEKSPGAKRSSSPWRTDFEAMARKSIIRRVCNFLDHDFEPLQKAVHEDEVLEVSDYSIDGDDDEETLTKLEGEEKD